MAGARGILEMDRVRHGELARQAVVARTVPCMCMIAFEQLVVVDRKGFDRGKDDACLGQLHGGALQRDIWLSQLHAHQPLTPPHAATKPRQHRRVSLQKRLQAFRNL
jgi:hypothetical protein